MDSVFGRLPLDTTVKQILDDGLDTTMLKKLKSLGLRGGPLLDELWDLRKDTAVMEVFSELLYCNFLLEGPDHDIDHLDPSFVPIANVGNGDYYGLYVYPPAQEKRGGENPVVQYFHEIPSVDYEAPTIEHWLASGVKRWMKDPDSSKSVKNHAQILTTKLKLDLDLAQTSKDSFWTKTLPTEDRIGKLKEPDLVCWLVDSWPPTDGDLLSWERQWVAWWTLQSANVDEEAALVDYGLEVYARLAWPLHEKALRSAQHYVVGSAKKERAKRATRLWCQAYPPSKADLGELVSQFSDGDRKARDVVEQWVGTYRWQEAVMHPDRAKERDDLCKSLVIAMSKTSNAKAREQIISTLLSLEAVEYADQLGPNLTDDEATVLDKLKAFRHKHQREQKSIVDANDWSDL